MNSHLNLVTASSTLTGKGQNAWSFWHSPSRRQQCQVPGRFRRIWLRTQYHQRQTRQQKDEDQHLKICLWMSWVQHFFQLWRFKKPPSFVSLCLFSFFSSSLKKPSSSCLPSLGPATRFPCHLDRWTPERKWQPCCSFLFHSEGDIIFSFGSVRLIVTWFVVWIE